MEYYPRTILEMEERFDTEEACRDYLFQLRWPEGFRCPRCGYDTAWHLSRDLHLCSRCRFQVSVTAGTIFQDTRKPLQLWFRAIWYVTSQKHGMSALGLKRVLGLGSYETAWTWLHKLRRAMIRPDRDRLAGRVETMRSTLVESRKASAAGEPKERRLLLWPLKRMVITLAGFGCSELPMPLLQASFPLFRLLWILAAPSVRMDGRDTAR